MFGRLLSSLHPWLALWFGSALYHVSVRGKGWPLIPSWGLVYLYYRYPLFPPLLGGGGRGWRYLSAYVFGDRPGTGSDPGAAPRAGGGRPGPRSAWAAPGAGGGASVHMAPLWGLRPWLCWRLTCWYSSPPLWAGLVPGMMPPSAVWAFCHRGYSPSVFFRALLGGVLSCAYTTGLPPVTYALMVTVFVTSVTPKGVR